jgi:hypothetical protein
MNALTETKTKRGPILTLQNKWVRLFCFINIYFDAATFLINIYFDAATFSPLFFICSFLIVLRSRINSFIHSPFVPPPK